MSLRVMLVDLSAIVHPIFHMSAADQERDQDYVSKTTVAKVRSLIAGVDRVAICCDSGRSFRHELDPPVDGQPGSGYKGNRGEPNAVLIHQARLAEESLAKEFQVWSCKGFEADDVIATAVAGLSEGHDVAEIVIASSDKDLMQLVSDGGNGRAKVVAQSLQTGAVYDEAQVKGKFGVTPAHIADYLAIVGDTADNVRGHQGYRAGRRGEVVV
jgi:DNA polymerase I